MQTSTVVEPSNDAAEKTDGISAIAAAKLWKAKLPRELRVASNARGLMLFGFSLAAYIVSFYWMCVAPRWTGIITGSMINALAIGAMFVAGHDAAHRTLVRSGWLNRILGRIAMLPAWHPFANWVYAHNTLHHGWTGFKGKHPDFCPLSKADYDALPRWRQFVERMYRAPLGVGACYVIEFYGKYLLLPTGDRKSPFVWAARWDRLSILAFMVVQVVVGTWLNANAWVPRGGVPHWLWSVLLVGGTWTMWGYFMGLASYQQHTHPRTAWYENIDEWNFYHVQLRSSTHVAMPAFVDRLLHNIMDHPAHHLDPTIPMYRLPESQQLLEEQAGEHAVVVPWTMKEFLRTCRVCKLYDYKTHCWIDFDGTPTSPSGLSGLPPMPKKAEAAVAV